MSVVGAEGREASTCQLELEEEGASSTRRMHDALTPRLLPSKPRVLHQFHPSLLEDIPILSDPSFQRSKRARRRLLGELGGGREEELARGNDGLKQRDRM